MTLSAIRLNAFGGCVSQFERTETGFPSPAASSPSPPRPRLGRHCAQCAAAAASQHSVRNRDVALLPNPAAAKAATLYCSGFPTRVGNNLTRRQIAFNKILASPASGRASLEQNRVTFPTCHPLLLRKFVRSRPKWRELKKIKPLCTISVLSRRASLNSSVN